MEDVKLKWKSQVGESKSCMILPCRAVNRVGSQKQSGIVLMRHVCAQGTHFQLGKRAELADPMDRLVTVINNELYAHLFVHCEDVSLLMLGRRG